MSKKEKKKFKLIFIDNNKVPHLVFESDMIEDIDNITFVYDNLQELSKNYGYTNINSSLIYKNNRQQYPVAYKSDELLRYKRFDEINQKFRECLSANEQYCNYYRPACARNSGESLAGWANRIALTILKPNSTYLKYRNIYFQIKYGFDFKRKAAKIHPNNNSNKSNGKVNKTGKNLHNPYVGTEEGKYDHFNELLSREDWDGIYNIYSNEEVEKVIRKSK